MDLLAQIENFQTNVHEVNGVATLKGLEVVFGNVVTLVLGLAGLVLFIMLIIGGFKYITSAGDPKATQAAGKTITAAILGLVLISLAYLILVFISRFTGVDVTQFRIDLP
jgi:TRAP-type C4-dicarboxylate transport system permease small subunit